jgi:hypothetical protein
VHLDDDAVRAHRERRTRQGGDLLAKTRAVARVDEDRQVAALPDRGHDDRSSVLRAWSAKVRTPRSQSTTL